MPRSGVSPPATLPGTRAKVSQIESCRPSACTAPSIWAAAVAAPQRKSGWPAAGRSRTGHQPFTAPVMMPEISCRPATAKSTSSGSVASTAPVRTTG